MAKKTPHTPEARPAAPSQTPPPQPEPEKDVSKAQIWTFWAGVIITVLTARALNYFLPGIPESTIERWVMLGFGVFVLVFLLRLK